MFEYEKMIIGYLIRYNRLKNKIYASDFIAYKAEQMDTLCLNCIRQCKNKSTIASHKTLERIERGIVSRKDCFYFDFAYKLGLKYDLSITNIKKVAHFEKELLRLIRYKKKEEFLNYQKNLKNLREINKGIIYFSDLIDIFYSVTELEIDNTYCSPDILDKMEYLLQYVKKDTKKIILYYLIRYYARAYNDKKYYTYIKMAKEAYLENIEIHFQQKAVELNTLDMLLYLQRYDKSEFKGSDILFYMQALAKVYEDLQKDDLALTCIDKAIAFCVNEKLVDPYLYQLYMKKGILLYRLGKYKQAIESFLKVYFYNIDSMGVELILFFHCYEILKWNDDIITLLTQNQLKNIRVDRVKSIFIYYRMKYHKVFTNKELENYILYDLKDYLEQGSLCERIIRDDLMKLSASTHNYKRLFSYFNEDKKLK